MHCSFKIASKKSQITRNTHNNKHLSGNNAEGSSCKTHYTDSEDYDIMAPTAVMSPDVEVRSSGTVQSSIVYPSTIPDLWVKICH